MKKTIYSVEKINPKSCNAETRRSCREDYGDEHDNIYDAAVECDARTQIDGEAKSTFWCVCAREEGEDVGNSVDVDLYAEGVEIESSDVYDWLCSHGFFAEAFSFCLLGGGDAQEIACNIIKDNNLDYDQIYKMFASIEL